MNLLTWIITLLVATSGAAEAGPVAAFVAAISGWFTATFGAALGGFLFRTVVSIAMSALSAAIRGKPEVRQPGITTNSTTAGGTVPQRLIFGRYATGGQMVAPMMVYQTDGNPNEWLVYVISLADKPITALNRIFVDGKALTIDGNPAAALYGDAMGATVLDSGDESLRNKIYVRFHDGRQAAADAYLLRVFGTYPERPWTDDMVGQGVAYVVITFKGKAQDGNYQGYPAVKIEVDGHALYDPRDAAQDPANEATWKFTRNPAVIAYNILRGIDLPGGDRWGVGARQFVMSHVLAAANTCDQSVPVLPSGTRVRYQAGLEISVADEPHQALTEIVKAMGGDVADMGGTWLLRAGPPAGPVLSITDDDIIVTDTRSLRPFPGLAETVNAIHASYPDPDQQWEAKEAIPLYDAALEAKDGGRRLIAEVDFPAVTDPRQVRALMREMLADHRRHRTHVVTLPPDAAGLMLGDHLAWSSVINGYQAKLFKVCAVRVDPGSLCVAVTLTERDPTDYDYDAGSDARVPTIPSVTPVAPTIAGITGWAVAAVNAGGRPGIRMSWNPEINARAISWVIRLAADNSVVNSGSTADLASGQVTVSAGLRPSTAYHVTGRLVLPRATTETSVITVTTLALGLTPDDFDVTAPDTPPRPSLTSTLTSLTASWAAEGGDVAYSELEYTESGGNPVFAQTGGNRHTINGTLPGTTFSVRRRRVDRVGNKSNWSLPATHTTARDTVPPAAPTGLNVVGTFGAFVVRWDRNSEADMAFYELAMGTAASPTTVISSTAATTVMVGDQPEKVLRHFRVRAVDTSGNRSAWSANASATTQGDPITIITTDDLKGLVDATSFGVDVEPIMTWTGAALPISRQTTQIFWKGRTYTWDAAQGKYVDLVSASNLSGVIEAAQFAMGIEPVTVHTGSSLPTTKVTSALMWQGKLYRWNGTAYVATIPAADIAGQVQAAQIAGLEASKVTGQITGTQISDSAISTPKLAAGAVVAGKIAAGAVEAENIAAGAVVAGKIAAGAVTATAIDADAVTAGKIAAGAVSADQIAAGAIVASKMAVGNLSNLVMDDDLQDISYWTRGQLSIALNATYGDTAAWAGSKGAFLVDNAPNNPSTASNVHSQWIPAAAGEEFFASAKVAATAPHSSQVMIQFADKDRGNLGTPSSPIKTSTAAETLTVAGVAPVGTRYVRFIAGVRGGSYPATGHVAFTAPVLRRKNGGELIVDGAVVATHLASNSVTSAKVQAGAILADKLAVGFGGNFITNSDFRSGTVGWALTKSGSAGAASALRVQSPGSWAGPDYPTLALAQNTADATGYADARFVGVQDASGALGKGWPVKDGDWIEVSVQSSVHRCICELRIQWLKEDGTVALHSGPVELPGGSGSETNPDTWPRTWLKATAPAAAAYAVIHIRKSATTSGTNSFLFVHKPMMTISSAERTEPSPYAPGTFTLVDGAGLLTGTVTARAVDVVDLAVSGLAKINEAYIKEANITGTLSASKIAAGSALAGSITVSGEALSSVRANAATGALDPVARINGGTTSINPGKITISGSTTLADWRYGGDTTSINGGAIAANTITANKLEIGSRNITLTGIQFEHNKPGTNQVSWTAGVIRWVNDVGTVVSTPIAAGAATWSSGVLYIYWAKGAGAFSVTTSLTVAMSVNNLCLATYEGDFRLDADYGRTVIDGDMIKTGSITATHLIKTAAVITETAQIKDLTVTALKIGKNQLYVPRFYSRADATLNDATKESSPVLLFNQNVPDFDGGGFILAFNAVVDSNINYDSFGRFQLLVDDVVRQTVSSGMRVSGANGGGFIPVSIIASYVGTGATNIKVRGWSHAVNDLSGATGNADCIVRNMTLTVSGARR